MYIYIYIYMHAYMYTHSTCHNTMSCNDLFILETLNACPSAQIGSWMRTAICQWGALVSHTTWLACALSSQRIEIQLCVAILSKAFVGFLTNSRAPAHIVQGHHANLPCL